MTQGHFKVVGIVGRRYLDGPGTEGGIDVAVGNNGYFPVDQGQNHRFTNNAAVALILGVYGYGRVAQHGFRSGSGHGNAAFPILKRIAHIPKAARFFFMFHLDIGNGGVAVGAPVYNIITPVDQSLFVEAYEYLAHGPGATRIHGKALPAPVAGGPQKAQLFGNTIAVLVFPCPDPLQKLLTAQVVFAQTFFGQFFFHPGLGGDAGMIGSR